MLSEKRDDDGSCATAADLHAVLSRAKRIVAFTGAGISTESGVPDFRSPGSPWAANRPIPYDRYIADPAARAEAWRRKFTMDDLYRHARPGPGHLALVTLYEEGRLNAVITQNIDNLHQASVCRRNPSSNCTATEATRHASPVTSGTNSTGCVHASKPRALPPRAVIAEGS